MEAPAQASVFLCTCLQRGLQTARTIMLFCGYLVRHFEENVSFQEALENGVLWKEGGGMGVWSSDAGRGEHGRWGTSGERGARTFPGSFLVAVEAVSLSRRHSCCAFE